MNQSRFYFGANLKGSHRKIKEDKISEINISLIIDIKSITFNDFDKFSN